LRSFCLWIDGPDHELSVELWHYITLVSLIIGLGGVLGLIDGWMDGWIHGIRDLLESRSINQSIKLLYTRCHLPPLAK
jgi:hypothetical protein